MIEIERKFLPSESFSLDEIQNLAVTKSTISQGYLNSNPNRTVRVRTKNNKGYITIKGIGFNSGTTRFEWEKEIPIHEAEQLLLLSEKGLIQKTRYNLAQDNHIFEIDVFTGQNKGLIIIEIELQSENEAFKKPHWLGKEVTMNECYFNAYLSQKPFTEW